MQVDVRTLIGLSATAALSVSIACSSNASDRDEVQFDCGKAGPDCALKASGDDDDTSTSAVNTEDAGDAPLTVDTGIVTLAPSESPLCMTVDEDTAFWVRADGTVGAIRTNSVPSTGDPIPTYAKSKADPGIGTTCGIAREGDYLYVTMFAASSLMRLHVTKPTLDTVQLDDDPLVIAGLLAPSSVALDAQFIYVTEYDTGAIRRIPKPDAVLDGGVADADAGDGGTSSDSLPGLGTAARDVFVDDTSVYWTSIDPPAVTPALRAMPKAGGAVKTLSDFAGPVLEIGDILYFQCAESLCSVETTGGLTTDTPVTSSMKPPFLPEVHGLGAFGDNLYFADGTSFQRTTFNTGPIFAYATASTDVRLYPQQKRMVWVQDSAILTRSVAAQ